MKKIVLAVALVAIGAAPVLAADLPAAPVYSNAPPVVAPVYNWTGFYVGLNAGGAISDTSYNTYPTGCYVAAAPCAGGPPQNSFRSALATFNGGSFTGGGQAGYNWQSGSAVFGIETDINFTGQNTSINQLIALPVPPFVPGSFFLNSTSDKLDWFGTLRGRAGFLATPTLLLYGTGGLAYGHVASTTVDQVTTTPDFYSASASTVRVGWTAGAGAEWMFAPNWSAKLEYLYVDLGTASYNVPCSNGVAFCLQTPPPTYQTDLRVRDNIVRVGVNYHFGGPVVAKY
jgi:outer membrane immunogenic protein